MSAEQPPAALARLLGQHPAALRRVRWVGPDPAGTTHDYLEIETKHGVVVVIDPVSGEVTANPPLPREIVPGATRVQYDLTERVPAAFDGRPVFTAVSVRDGVPRTYRIRLSTGVELTLTGGDAVPVTSAGDA